MKISDREILELMMRREGLTQPQTDACMVAADVYATAQAKAAIDALDFTPPLVHYLASVSAGTQVACGKKNQDLLNTRLAHRVTCEACKETPAWKKAA